MSDHGLKEPMRLVPLVGDRDDVQKEPIKSEHWVGTSDHVPKEKYTFQNRCNYVDI